MEVFFGRNQFPVFVSFVVCGVIAGIVYDLFKIKRKIFGSPWIVLFVDDLLFMLLCTLLITFNAFALNNGNYKWYEIPFMVTGFAIYRMTLSKLVTGICFYIIAKFKSLACRLLLKPFILAVKKIRKFVEAGIDEAVFFCFYHLKKRSMCGYRF